MVITAFSTHDVGARETMAAMVAIETTVAMAARGAGGLDGIY
jgi:hypothetical protein